MSPLKLDTSLHILEDSGAPAGSHNHTTIILLSLLLSGVFEKMIPFARPHNTRLLLVNRRDYPGTRPFTKEERALLPTISPAFDWEDEEKIAAAKGSHDTFTEARAREVYDFLVELVKSGEVPRADHARNTGGIVIAGWSLAAIFMTALLAHVASFAGSQDDVNLNDFVRRVVLLDPPYIHLGLPEPPKPMYSPMFDDDIASEERQKAFMNWVSGYFKHGGSAETLEDKTPLRHPPPTISTLRPEEIGRLTCGPPGEPGGSDEVLVHSGVLLGLFAALRTRALFFDKGEQDRDLWKNVEVRCVSSECSISAVVWSAIALRREIEEAKAKGVPTRNIRFVLIRGANHFVHWDKPELALRALVGDEDVIE